MKNLARGRLYVSPPDFGTYMCPACFTSETITASVTWLDTEGVWPMATMRRCLRCSPLSG